MVCLQWPDQVDVQILQKLLKIKIWYVNYELNLLSPGYYDEYLGKPSIKKFHRKGLGLSKWVFLVGFSCILPLKLVSFNL